jgi:hypothetical protein
MSAALAQDEAKIKEPHRRMRTGTGQRLAAAASGSIEKV